MSRKKAKTGNGQVAHDLVEWQVSKRKLEQKLRRQKRTRDQELEPLQRQVARLQRQIEQISLRHDAPIDATAMSIAEIEVKIGLYTETSFADVLAEARSDRRPQAQAVSDPFSAGIFPMSMHH